MSLTEVLEVKERNLDYARNIFSSQQLRENIITFKLISRALSAAGLKVKELGDKEFLNHEVFETAQLELVAALAELGHEVESEVILYQTGDISKFFGVSQTTISNWIALNRFEGVSRPQPGKHVDIPANTVFTYPNGKQDLVKDVADEFEERMHRARAEELEENETVFLGNRLKEYEARYTSIELLEELLNSGPVAASERGLDLEVWKYLSRRKDALLV